MFYLLAHSQFDSSLGALLSPEEELYSTQIRHEQVKCNWITGRILIKWLAVHGQNYSCAVEKNVEGNINLSSCFEKWLASSRQEKKSFRRVCVISRSAAGRGCAPYIKGLGKAESPLRFSLTHVDNLVAAATSAAHNIGLDLCKPGSVSGAVIRNFFTENEQRLVNQSAQAEVVSALIWSGKEAAFKASDDCDSSPFIPQNYELTLSLESSENLVFPVKGSVIRLNSKDNRREFHVEFTAIENMILAITE